MHRQRNRENKNINIVFKAHELIENTLVNVNAIFFNSKKETVQEATHVHSPQLLNVRSFVIYEKMHITN